MDVKKHMPNGFAMSVIKYAYSDDKITNIFIIVVKIAW